MQITPGKILIGHSVLAVFYSEGFRAFRVIWLGILLLPAPPPFTPIKAPMPPEVTRRPMSLPTTWWTDYVDDEQSGQP